MPIKVLKFGGTSVAGSFPMHQTYEIVRAKSSDKLIVVLSALAGVTNRLTELLKLVSVDHKPQKTQILDIIENCHLQLIHSLFQAPDASQEAVRSFREYLNNLKLLLEGVEILEELTPRVKDEILAFGEFFSSRIFYDYCKYKGMRCCWLDAREVIATDDTYQNARPDLHKIKANAYKIIKLFEDYDVVITQGFVGSSGERTTTLGRGGSDLSASLFAYSIEAEEIQIWTDVDGVLSADPKLVEHPITIPVMSFDEVIELSFFGAKVLHPETIKPAMLENIPVRVLNTFNPLNEGTLIVNDVRKLLDASDIEAPQIHSIVLLENCFLIKKRLTPFTKGFADYYKILQLPEAKILHYNGNRNYFKSIIKIESNEEVVRNIFEEEQIDPIKIDLIAFCGYNLHKPSRKVFNQINEAMKIVKPYTIYQFVFRSSDNSIILALEEGKGKEIIGQLHNILVA